MTDPRKVVLLIIPNLDFGGAQTSFAKLSMLLGQHFKVINVVFNRSRIAEYTFGGELMDLEVSSGGNAFKKILNFYRRIRKVKYLKRKYDVAVSISFLEGADYVNILSRTHDRIVISIRGSKKNDQNIKGWLGLIRHRILIPILYRNADQITAVSEGIRNELCKFYRLKRTQVIPNFYDLALIRKNASVPILDEYQIFFKNRMTISISGRLMPEKGFDRFIYVFAALKRRFDLLSLVILGDGDERQTILTAINECNLTCSDSPESNPDILLAGYQANPFKFISHTTVFALPSLHEGFPNALIEAMAIGIPVAAADCPYGPAEILMHQNSACGLLLPVLKGIKEREIWIDKLANLLSDEGERSIFSEKGMKRVEDFSLELVSEKWISLVEGK